MAIHDVMADYGTTSLESGATTGSRLANYKSLVRPVVAVSFALSVVGFFAAMLAHDGSAPSISADHLSFEEMQQMHALASRGSDKPKSSGTVTWTAMNEYNTMGERRPGAAYPNIDADTLVEPGRETTLEVQTDGLATCTWKVEQTEGGGAYYFSTEPHYDHGLSVIHTFMSPGTYKVKALCIADDSTGSVYTGEQSHSCRYVRRELRKITEADRELFLDSFMIMAHTSEAEGKSLYGDNFKTLDKFVSEHLAAAGPLRLDHAHDGYGLATQHISLSNAFEYVLQSINTKATIPFWDYTIDHYWVKKTYGDGKVGHIFHDGPLFAADWFGRTNMKRHTVTEGRFAYQTISIDNNASVNSPYGYLRAPWNLNPSPYVTRYHKSCGHSMSKAGTITQYDEMAVDQDAQWDFEWPSCANHYYYTFEVDDWATWSFDIGYTPHGPVHAWLGGVGGECETWNETLTEWGMHDDYADTAIMAFTYLKNAYRNKQITLPSYCSLDSKDECMWTCEESLKESDDRSLDKLIYCDTKFWPGDHLEAASATEASFWPIHPTIDRLLQYKEMAKPFTNRSWPSSGACLESTGTECKGHNPYDLTFWESTVSIEDGTFAKSYYSNQEIRDMIRPSSYRMAYIYSDFEWSHCEEEGYTFRDVTPESQPGGNQTQLNVTMQR